jgi:hypothetical protein
MFHGYPKEDLKLSECVISSKREDIKSAFLLIFQSIGFKIRREKAIQDSHVRSLDGRCLISLRF